ncbi:MAG: phospholipase D family protein [Clostridium sp.]
MKAQRSGKRALIVLISIFVLGYMLMGAIAPFLKSKDVSEEFKNKFDINNFFSDKQSVDKAKLIETNEDALNERIRLLEQAKEKIIFSTYDLREGESTRDTLAVILTKADEGVKVRIIVDGMNSIIRMEGRAVFYALSAHPNVEIKLYNSLKILQPWKTQGRMHDKYIIVDDIGYILGGRNSHDAFIGAYEAKADNIDREVLIYNSAHGTDRSNESSLKELETYSEGVWDSKDNELFHRSISPSKEAEVEEQRELLRKRYVYLKEEWPQLFGKCNYDKDTIETNKVTIISNPTHIYGKEPWVFYSLIQLMAKAGNEVRIYSPYAVMNDYMLTEFTKVSNNVEDFKLVINSVENGDNIVASSDYIRNKKRLIDTGVDIYEYDGGISNHGKSVLIDEDISVVGSFNFDMRSTYMNTELMLIIHSGELNQELKRNMDYMEKDCRRVIDEDTYETPEHIKVKEVNIFKKLLWWIIGLVMQLFRFLV